MQQLNTHFTLFHNSSANQTQELQIILPMAARASKVSVYEEGAW